MISSQNNIQTLSDRLCTEEAIATVKTTFEKQLSGALNLTRISAPMIVLKGTGINDDLNGIERPVSFPIKAMQEQQAEVVQSLAKWKRLRVREYELSPGTGILTDMRALRPDEDPGPLHSVYVDQWDWELVISEDQRHLSFLKDRVTEIYNAILKTEAFLANKYPLQHQVLPPEITFIHAEDLLQKYPGHTPKERENLAAKEFGAIFLVGIGGKLTDGLPHDSRAPDYDDWSTRTSPKRKGLNGDIIFWNPVLEQGFEISSMGIRVNAEVLETQLKEREVENRKDLFYHRELLKKKLPQTIGGGIGQSRLCMFLLKKKHIGQVQVSIWPEALREDCAAQGISLL